MEGGDPSVQPPPTSHLMKTGLLRKPQRTPQVGLKKVGRFHPSWWHSPLVLWEGWAPLGLFDPSPRIGGITVRVYDYTLLYVSDRVYTLHLFHDVCLRLGLCGFGFSRRDLFQRRHELKLNRFQFANTYST